MCKLRKEITISFPPFSYYRMMWAAGVLASVSSITYPAISAFVSMHSDADKQGLAQGMITGMRGLCNGLGPAMFGVIFYLFHVDLNDRTPSLPLKPALLDENNNTGTATHLDIMPQVQVEKIYLYFLLSIVQCLRKYELALWPRVGRIMV